MSIQYHTRPAHSDVNTLYTALEHVPEAVRQAGLMEAHVAPFVSRGKDTDDSFAPLFRVPISRAWAYPEIELRTPTSWPVLTFDVDGQDRLQRVKEAVYFEKSIPTPSWIAERPGGNAHVAYVLRRPVLRGRGARPGPLRLMKRVAEYLSAVLGADPAYAGVVTHNPTSPLYKTAWGFQYGFDLGSLNDSIPEAFLTPRAPQTGVGRNVDLFMGLCRFAGSPHRQGFDLAPIAKQINLQFPHPLPPAEVRSISRSVERYRDGWQFFTSEQTTAWARQRQAYGVNRRRQRNHDRDGLIRRLAAEGLDLLDVAAAVDVSKRTIARVLQDSRELW